MSSSIAERADCPPASPLPGRFLESWERARQSLFWRRWSDLLASDEELAARSARVTGREASFLAEEVLPALDPGRRSALLGGLAEADPRDAVVAACALHLQADHRPFLIADECLRKHSERIERRYLLDAIEYLQPREFFRIHLPRGSAARLREAWPAGFDRTGVRTLPELAAAGEEAACAAGGLPAAERRALSAWRALVERPRAFDYGCGLGALLEVLGSDFEATGGDLYDGSVAGELRRSLATLRAGASLDEDPARSPWRPVALDPTPGPDSPPADTSFGLVTCNGVMEHVLEPAAFDAVLDKLLRLLRPGGVLFLSTTPTMLGYDGHHALSPWWGPLLHRAPALRRRFFAGRWREGFTHPVSRRRLLAPFRDGAVKAISRWPSPSTVRAKLGPVAPLALPVLRLVSRTGLCLSHAYALPRRIDAAPC